MSREKSMSKICVNDIHAPGCEHKRPVATLHRGSSDGQATVLYADGSESEPFTPAALPLRFPCPRCRLDTSDVEDALCWRCSAEDRLSDRQRAYLAAQRAVLDRRGAPHCDADVLHGPAARCWACDMPQFDELRALRAKHRIRFTGERYPHDWEGCPAEVYRPLETIERWHGNVAETPELRDARRADESARYGAGDRI